MQLSGDEPGQVSEHVTWRMASARRAARVYAANRKLAALAVAGSVGVGLADSFSDLELDCYWSSPPTDADRTGPVIALGGELTSFWDYDAGDREWSEDCRIDSLSVTVSNFLTSTIEQFLDDVVMRTDTGPVKHMRLAALKCSRPLVGEQFIAPGGPAPTCSPARSPAPWCSRHSPPQPVSAGRGRGHRRSRRPRALRSSVRGSERLDDTSRLYLVGPVGRQPLRQLELSAPT